MSRIQPKITRHTNRKEDPCVRRKAISEDQPQDDSDVEISKQHFLKRFYQGTIYYELHTFEVYSLLSFVICIQS